MRATVVILTLNGEEHLADVLDACLGQEAPFEFEVMVIDSGSTDSTLEIVSHRPEVRLVQIPNVEFGHGRTRNLAVSVAAGEIVAFLTQDATPAGSGWLAALIGALDADPSLGAVYGRQIARPHSPPAIKRDVTDAFDRPGGVASSSAAFFSNVNSAVRKEVLQRIPFRDVDYAEDRALAADLHAAGIGTAYVAQAPVLHSHDLRIGEYARRMYDEACGLRGVGAPPRAGVLWLLAGTVRGTVRDWRFIASDRDYGTVEKLAWAAKAPLYNAARRSAIRLAMSDRVPGRLRAALSLDHQRRSRAAGGAGGGPS